ncbi:MAG: tRNA (adenosine(37)-N6)-threonylcarbamoyltransferase complex transferase subunit TsaD [bacterium]|nr:tRNA (adenosine(37)-N6)-threonylcarbamoyltransferase complex transferase subunit TsaD [bacterium]
MTYILGIDTSCDETSAAVLSGYTILSNTISSQIELHKPYGGVFPTVAKLAHQENIQPVIATALKAAHLKIENLDAVAVTIGPGLAPALEIGIRAAKELAQKQQLPLIGINHLEGHLLSPLAQANSTSKQTFKFEFPVLGILVSGGHSQFIKMDQVGKYEIIGETLDDAAGECLDKIGRLLNLGYPAAPVIEQLAKTGDSQVFPFPLPLTTRYDYDLSFSGLKTYARNLIGKMDDKKLDRQTLANLAASSQAGVFRHLTYKLDKLLNYYQNSPAQTPFKTIFVGGGVAQNVCFRTLVRKVAAKYELPIHFPYNKRLCGDNAAMIALAALWHYQNHHFADIQALERQPNLNFKKS